MRALIIAVLLAGADGGTVKTNTKQVRDCTLLVVRTDKREVCFQGTVDELADKLEGSCLSYSTGGGLFLNTPGLTR